MKANELSCKDLMIGDYVYGCIETDIVGEATYRILCKVKEIAEDIVVQCIEPLPDELDWQDGDDFSWIEPIPLTPEILEKNGFIKESRDCFGESLQYCVLVDGLWIDISGENYFEGKLDYVHQLQHALKNCEIEKEIEL